VAGFLGVRAVLMFWGAIEAASFLFNLWRCIGVRAR
jgi:hypothetical protein